MPLSDTTCKNAHKNSKAASGKAFTLFDAKGLHLLIKPISGGWAKYWRLKYRYNDKGFNVSWVYPETSLQQAREKRDVFRKHLAEGINPIENRKAVKESKAEIATNSFEIIAREWGQKKVETRDDRNNRIQTDAGT